MHFKDMNIHLTQSVLKMSIHFMKMAWDWTWYIIFGRYKYANISEARNTNVVNEWTRRLNVSQISARITDWSKCTLDSYANTTNTHTPQNNHIWCESAKLFFLLSFLQIVEPKRQNFSWHNKRTQSKNIKKQKWYVPNKNTFVHFEYLNIRTYVPFAQRYCTILRAKEGKQAQICAIFLIKSLSQMNCSRRLCNIVIIFAYFNRTFVVWFSLVVCLPFACSLARWLFGWLVIWLVRLVGVLSLAPRLTKVFVSHLDIFIAGCFGHYIVSAGF